MPSKFEITGIPEIDKALKALEKNVARKVIRQAIRKALKPVAQAAKNNAPQGATGNLKKAIKVAAARKSRKSFGLNVTVGEKNFVGKQFYGAFQEFGWKTGKRGSENRTQIEGEHFMDKAFEQTKNRARDIAQDEIRKGIEAQARKQG